MRPTHLMLLFPLWLAGSCSETEPVQATIEQAPAEDGEPSEETAEDAEPASANDSADSADLADAGGAAASEPSGEAAMVPPMPEGVTDPVEILRAHEALIAERSEHDASSVKVQHILIGHAGANLPGVRRPTADAELFAAETYLELVEGADFAALMKERSDDSGPGVYGMYKGKAMVPGYRPRRGMVGAFGDIAWRLEVGQIGVAPLGKSSPYGWHIIQRIE